jgi:hypothetical protein
MDTPFLFEFAWGGKVWSVSVPSDIQDHERFLYVQAFVSTQSPVEAKRMVFVQRFPGIAWSYQDHPFAAKSFTSFESIAVSSENDTSSLVSKTNTCSPHVSSAHEEQVTKGVQYHTSRRNIHPAQCSTSSSSLPLYRHSEAAPLRVSWKKPMNVSMKDMGGWKGSVSTK